MRLVTNWVCGVSAKSVSFVSSVGKKAFDFFSEVNSRFVYFAVEKMYFPTNLIKERKIGKFCSTNVVKGALLVWFSNRCSKLEKILKKAICSSEIGCLRVLFLISATPKELMNLLQFFKEKVWPVRVMIFWKFAASDWVATINFSDVSCWSSVVVLIKFGNNHKGLNFELKKQERESEKERKKKRRTTIKKDRNTKHWRQISIEYGINTVWKLYKKNLWVT